jgi:aminoglycoside phosphotransferase (APT) family kinase protein
MLAGAVRQAHGRHLAALRPRATREPAIQRWLATSERLLARAEPAVDAAAESGPRPASIVHLGLWPAHVLLAEEHVSGLLGWERAAAGSPLLDLAQATLRLQGWSEDAVEMAVGAYGDVQSLSPEERRLLPAIAALDAVAATGRLLEQTFGVEGAGRPPSAARSAVDMMLTSMAALDRNLTPSAVKKTRRTFRPPPRPDGHRKGANPDGRRR